MKFKLNNINKKFKLFSLHQSKLYIIIHKKNIFKILQIYQNKNICFKIFIHVLDKQVKLKNLNKVYENFVNDL